MKSGGTVIRSDLLRRIRTNPEAGPPVVEAKTAEPDKLLHLKQMLAAGFGSACIISE